MSEGEADHPPFAHALRIEAVSDARHDFLTGRRMMVLLDDKPLHSIRSIDIRIGASEIVTATICVELGKVEIPNGIAELQVVHFQEDQAVFRCIEPFVWEHDGVREDVRVGDIADKSSAVYRDRPDAFEPVEPAPEPEPEPTVG
jgi:hypothetical protein